MSYRDDLLQRYSSLKFKYKLLDLYSGLLFIILMICSAIIGIIETILWIPEFILGVIINKRLTYQIFIYIFADEKPFITHFSNIDKKVKKLKDQL